MCLAAFLAVSTTAMAQSDGDVTLTPTTQYADASQLPGIDPSKDYATGTYNANNNTKPTDGKKILCFYNMGAKKFLSIGGYWGTHASLNTTPHALWLETNSAGDDNVFYINHPVAGSGTGTHLGIQSGNVYMDKGLQSTGGYVRTVSFEKSDSYTETNKTYYVKIGSDGYLTAYPDNADRYCNYQTALASTAEDRKNQEWKVITKDEYYELAKTNPANMASLIDFSFLMTSPDFRVNDSDIKKWQIGRLDQNKDLANKIMFGDNYLYRTYSLVGTTNWTAGSTKGHQDKYGKYFYCWAKGQQNFYLYQDVTIHQAGWYVLRCNGFTTQQETVNGSVQPKCHLFVSRVKDGNADWSQTSSATLNLIGRDDANALVTSNSNAGAGVAFFNGQYENQVQLCVDDPKDGTAISSDNPVTLRVGFLVDAYTDASQLNAADITAVDNFKLLYAGPRRNPELILDEDSHDMLYITEANDTYTNSVLHLNRKFNDHQWNSLVLPVNLTAGQLKRTYGDAVKAAKLDRIEGNVVFFVTEETSNDDENIIEAFTPYIIYPPVVDTTSPAYTAPHFYTNEKDADDNSQFLDKGYASTSEESEALTKTIPANHYTITMVSLDRELLKKHVDVTEVDGKYTWRTNTNVVTTGSEMTCYATLAKTYYDSNDVKAGLCAEDQKGIIAGRDNLAGDYVMREGKLVQVPHDKQYGLKGFRCWFELADPSSSSKLSLNIDGVEDGTTGINDIVGDEALFTTRARGINGVFSLDGQRVRTSNDTRSLPRGIYISNGRKVVVR